MTKTKALALVAEDIRKAARETRENDPYADHVTEDMKDLALVKSLAYADRVQSGVRLDLSAQQKVHYKMTGECLPILGS